MRVRDAIAEIRKGDYPRTVVLWGSDPYVRSVGTREIVKAAGVRVPEMNLIRFEGTPDMRELKNALARVPFMSPVKVVLLEDTEILSKNVASAVSKQLEDAELGDGTLFVISALGALDKRKSFVKSLPKSALVIECSPLKGDALTRYIQSEAARRGRHIGRKAAEAVAQRTEEDLFAAESELDKLTCVTQGQITAEDVEKYTPPSPETNMFGTVDLFLVGRTQEAYREVEALLAQDPSPIGFLTFLANTFRQMLVARACRDAGFSEKRTVECIVAETGAREWAARKSYERCRRFTASQLRRKIEFLGDVDFGVKQGAFVLRTDLYAILSELFLRP